MRYCIMSYEQESYEENYGYDYEPTSEEFYADAEEFSRETLKLLDEICEGVDVPTDEESAESARDHHGDISTIGQAKIDPSSHPSQRHPNGWVMPHHKKGE